MRACTAPRARGRHRLPELTGPSHRELPRPAWRRCKAWLSAWPLVSHGINQIVDAVPVSQRGHVFRIFRGIGVLPRVANVRVVVHGDHHAVPVVIHGAPGRAGSEGLLYDYAS